MYILAGLAVVVFGAGLLFMKTGSASSGLPGYASGNSLVKEAYLYATEKSEELNGVNCYCGCMQHQHGGRLHSRGLLDCFRTTSDGYDQHGSQCGMCIEDALTVKRMNLEGKTKSEAIDYIDSKYA